MHVIFPIVGSIRTDGEHCENCTDMFLPFPKRQISDSSKLKEFADNYFKYDENGVKFSEKK